MSSSRRQFRRTRTLRSRWTWPPSSVSSERRAAKPISPILAPPRPIRIPFWDSVSAQISADHGDQAVLARLDLGHLDLDRVRDLLAGPVQHLLADQLGEQQLARLVGGVLRRIHIGTLGDQLAEPMEELVEAVALAGADREDLVDGGQRGRLGERVDGAAGGRSGRTC